MSEGPFQKCKKCGASWEPEFVRMDNGVHYGKETCQRCGGFIRWVPKPKGERKAREREHREAVNRYSRGFCEMCGILEDRIPRGETLHAHHVDEYRADGSAERENIWIVCTRCHTKIHHERIYIGHLIPDGVRHVDRKERASEHESVGELDSLEDGQPERRQANEGANSADGDSSGEFDGPDDMVQF